jgi:hypothetical protein
MASLDLCEGFIVVDILWGLAQVDNKLGVPIGQEPVHLMRGVQPFIIKNAIDVSVQWIKRDMYLEHHFNL